MKNCIFTIISISALLLITLSGCEKVIDLELKDSEPVIVIYGDINDQLENQYVRISKSYNFTEPNKFNAVTGARVIITSQAGSVINYSEITPGVYQSPKFRGITGVKYTLDITVEGQKFTATSTMPEKVFLDSLNFREVSFFGKNSTHLVANFHDPLGIQNQYRYLLSVKNKAVEDLVTEDRFNDGNKVANTIYHDLNDLEPGDDIELDLQCIDRNVYKYYYAFGQNSGEGGPPIAPANPPSNISNGALGIFSVHTSSKKVAKVK
ncbi:MAG: DUF4249 domain-containing protein [Flavobacterium sp.]|nr:MAG: DUF4249 domain-containing protein [Flavobacterium sp.]